MSHRVALEMTVDVEAVSTPATRRRADVSRSDGSPATPDDFFAILEAVLYELVEHHDHGGITIGIPAAVFEAVLRDRREVIDALAHVQQRCTELLEEGRAAKHVVRAEVVESVLATIDKLIDCAPHQTHSYAQQDVRDHVARTFAAKRVT